MKSYIHFIYIYIRMALDFWLTALATKGTVREARGFASMMYTCGGWVIEGDSSRISGGSSGAWLESKEQGTKGWAGAGAARRAGGLDCLDRTLSGRVLS